MRESTEHTRPAVALVTGASSGIGRATATEMARRGWHVLVGFHSGRGRAEAVASSLEREFGVHARPVAIALDEPAAAVASLDAALELADASTGPVRCLINNAGINDRTPAHQIELPRAAEVFAVDALSPIALASAFARRLIEQRLTGTIVNITSVHETIPITGGVLYCSAKAALGMATKVMALEFATHGIRVNAVAPGETATPMNGMPEGADVHTVHRPAIPLGRPGHPDEIAAVAAFLAGPGSSYLTGASLTVDGGLVLTAAEENARAATYSHTRKEPRP